MSDPRKHHFLPQFYLEGFTANGKKDEFLHVIDLRSGKQWPARPSNVAFQVDLHTVKWDGDPYQLEKDLAAGIENVLSPILKKVLAEEALPKDRTIDHISDLVAMLAARVPSEIEAPVRFQRSMFMMHMRAQLASEETWVRFCKEDGAPNMLYADALKCPAAFESGDVRMVLNNNVLMKKMLEAMDRIRRLLDWRRWTLITAPSGVHFLCSDRPVHLSWASEMPAECRPDCASPGSWIFLPLSRSIGLIGVLEPGGQSGQVNLETVAMLNGLVIGQTARQVYSPFEDFNWCLSDRKLLNAADLVAMVKRAN